MSTAKELNIGREKRGQRICKMAAAKRRSAGEEEAKIEETWGSLVSLIRSKDGGLEEGNTIKMVKKEVTIGRCKGTNLHHNTCKNILLA